MESRRILHTFLLLPGRLLPENCCLYQSDGQFVHVPATFLFPAPGRLFFRRHLVVPSLTWRAILLAGVCRRSEEHTSELQSLMRISYAVFCLKKKIILTKNTQNINYNNT